MNKVIISGNLGKNPDQRTTSTGQVVTNFSVATNRRWVNQETGEVKEETVWFRVTCWGRLAETTNQYLKQGSKVMVEGRINVSAYISHEGEARASLELTAQSVEFLDPAPQRAVEEPLPFEASIETDEENEEEAA